MPVQTLELIVAEGCNLNCSYCFEHFKQPVQMDFELAKQVIKEHLLANNGQKELIIDFMGGEPMIAFPLIKHIVEYVSAQTWPKCYHFSMSTNGTLFSEDNKPWFEAHKKIFTPMLSFDGTKMVHDMNRSNSYGRIIKHIDFIKNNWSFQTVKMTVNDRALPYLADGVLSILAMGLLPEPNLVYEPVWGNGKEKQDNMRILEYELARLIDFYSEKYELNAPMLINLPIHNCLGPEREKAWRWCGAGEAMMAVDMNGISYPCHRFMTFSSGNSMTLDEYLNPEINNKLPCGCDSCPMFQACPTCEANNWKYNGSINNRVVNSCELLKLQMVASAALKLNRVHKRILGKDLSKVGDEALAEAQLDLKSARNTLEILKDIPQGELKPYVTGDWPGGPGWENRVRWFERREPINSTEYFLQS